MSLYSAAGIDRSSFRLDNRDKLLCASLFLFLLRSLYSVIHISGHVLHIVCTMITTTEVKTKPFQGEWSEQDKIGMQKAIEQAELGLSEGGHLPCLGNLK